MKIGRIGHILLVERDDSVREATASVLENAGFAVSPVATADEAVDGLREGERPALVLSEHEPPDVDGSALMRLIAERWPFIPVVLCSHAMTRPMRALLIGQGADACFDKPVDTVALVGFLRERMGRPASDDIRRCQSSFSTRWHAQGFGRRRRRHFTADACQPLDTYF